MATLQEKIEEVIEKLSKKVPLELNADDGLQDSNWNATVASIKLLSEALTLIKTTPSSLPYKGAPYFRIPGMQKPWDALPFTIENDWVKVHNLYKGDFMRLAGGNASKFKTGSTSISYDSSVKGDGGGQMDALQDHKHSYKAGSWNDDFKDGRNDEGLAGWTDYDTKSVKNARSDIETRPKNITVELYIYKGKDV